MHAAHEDVFVTVVIVIADRDGVVEAYTRETGLFGDIFEVAFPVVFEEAVGVLCGGLFQRPNIGSVGEENIQIAVVVIVEDRYPTGHGFRRMALRRLTTVELEVDGPIKEMDGCLGIPAGSAYPNRSQQCCRRPESRRRCPGPCQDAHSAPPRRCSIHGAGSFLRPGTLMSGSCGSSFANSFTLANSESASCLRPKERKSLPRW